MGLLGIHQNGTTDIVLAEQRALRAAQHLNILHINSVQQLGVRTRYVDPIQVHPHTWVQYRIATALTNAAYEDRRGFVVGLRKLQAGREGFQIFYVADAEPVEGIRSHRRHRNRGVLQIFSAPTGGDHNLLQHSPPFRLGRYRGTQGAKTDQGWHDRQ